MSRTVCTNISYRIKFFDLSGNASIFISLTRSKKLKSVAFVYFVLRSWLVKTKVMKMIATKVCIMSSNGHVEIIPYPGTMHIEVNMETASSDLIISNDVRCVEEVPTSSQQIDVSNRKIVEEQTYVDTIKSIGKEIQKKKRKKLRVKSRIQHCRDVKRLAMYDRQLGELEEEIKALENKIIAAPIFNNPLWKRIIESQKKAYIENDSNI